MKAVRWIFLIFLGVGSIVLAVAALSFLHTRQFVHSSSAGDGVVIENVWRESSGRSRGGSYYPRVRFRTGSGQDFVIISSTGSSPPSFRVGERVQVLYSPDNPTRARIDSFGSLWALPLIFGCIGLVFCSVGIGPLLWQRRVHQRDEWLRAGALRPTLTGLN